jgi:UDP-N-acetylglucosamine 2-epimerase
MKVLTILGTRPEIIRISCVINCLEKHTKHILVHTGQNYDYELNEIFFEELGIKKPDYFMNVNTTSLGNVFGGIMIKTEEILKKEKPDAVLILGDTNSFVAAIITKRMKIPIYHMEAGNRCFDMNVPEEANRKIIDHVSDFNLCYTEHARRHLISEGLPHRRIYVTGSPMREVLATHIEKIKASDALGKLKLQGKQYFLASIHREENVDRSENLGNLLEAFEKIVKVFEMPVIVSTHPRTKNRLERLGKKDISKKIVFLKPFGFFDKCVISDSGTICEESSILNFPAITVRNAIERPEAMDTGSIVVTGVDPDVIIEAIKLQISQDMTSREIFVPDDYKIDNTSHRVVKLILGTAKLSNLWNGIKYNDLS